MSRSLYALLVAQFLSAFSDNAILFTVVAIVLQSETLPTWYVPALQSVFLIAFVALTPWVGPFADKYPKPRVLIVANAIKAFGGFLILAGLEPLIAYAIVGVGAAVYSPAKYGILPELVDHSQLVKANSWIEGATIASILLGTVGGARVADYSISLALALIIILYLISAATTLLIPRLPARGAHTGPVLRQLWVKIKSLLISPRARLILLGLSLFWASAATLRVLLVVWAPLVLHVQTASQIAELTLFLAFGIIIGSAIVPRLIPLEHIRRTRAAAYGMALCFVLLASVDGIWPARGALLALGTTGGIFVVPLNAAIQDIGHRSIGSGGAVAIQNFFQNAAMLLGVGAYTFAAAHGGDPVTSILVLGGLVLIATFAVSSRLPKLDA